MNALRKCFKVCAVFGLPAMIFAGCSGRGGSSSSGIEKSHEGPPLLRRFCR